MTCYKQQYESYYSSLRSQVKDSGYNKNNHSHNDNLSYLPYSYSTNKKEKSIIMEVVTTFVVQSFIALLLLVSVYVMKNVNNSYWNNIFVTTKKAIVEETDYNEVYAELNIWAGKVREAINTNLTK